MSNYCQIIEEERALLSPYSVVNKRIILFCSGHSKWVLLLRKAFSSLPYILRKLLRNVTYAYMQKMQLFVFKICALWLNLLSFYHFAILFYHFRSILFNETVVYIVIIFSKSFFPSFLCGYDHCILYIEYYRLLICVKDSCHCSLSYSGKCLYKLYLFVYQICSVSYNFQVFFFFIYLTWLTSQNILLKNNTVFFIYLFWQQISRCYYYCYMVNYKLDIFYIRNLLTSSTCLFFSLYSLCNC